MTPCPEVRVTIRRESDYWELSFRCSHCKATHYHGGGALDEPPLLGHRLAHCHSTESPYKKTGYDLVADDITPDTP